MIIISILTWFLAHLPILLKSKKPNRKPYSTELKTYGDHLRKKRLDLNIFQSQMAKIINVTADTIRKWELNRNEPTLTQIPKIISFLGYLPKLNENPIKSYRIQKGISPEEISKILKIDFTTFERIEKGGDNISSKVKVKLDCLF